MFLESTICLCNSCQKTIEGKIIKNGSSIFLQKLCKDHGIQEELLEEDASYYFRKREFDKPGNKIKPDTKFSKGCPFDCGLCPNHEQHSCNAIIDITDRCDMGCPTCYASSGKGKDLSLDKIEKMMDFFQERENNEAEILQISGGEPTVHPQILEILALSKKKKFRYVLLNTNGLRIARDENFAKELSKFRDRENHELFRKIRYEGEIRELPLLTNAIRELAYKRVVVREKKIWVAGAQSTAGVDLTDTIEAGLHEKK